MQTTAKLYLRNSHMGRAGVLDRLEKFADAERDWARAIVPTDPAKRNWLFARHAKSLFKAGKTAEAIATVAELAENPNWEFGQWYDFACIYSVASGKIASRKQEYADRALELLRKAVKAGYKDAAHMKKDTDLDPLRERDDCKKLLSELEKGADKK